MGCSKCGSTHSHTSNCSKCTVRKEPEVCGCKIKLSSKCVINENPNLEVFGIQEGDNLDTMFKKLAWFMQESLERMRFESGGHCS